MEGWKPGKEGRKKERKKGRKETEFKRETFLSLILLSRHAFPALLSHLSSAAPAGPIPTAPLAALGVIVMIWLPYYRAT